MKNPFIKTLRLRPPIPIYETMRRATEQSALR